MKAIIITIILLQVLLYGIAIQTYKAIEIKECSVDIEKALASGGLILDK